jgi:hypothetical protein
MLTQHAVEVGNVGLLPKQLRTNYRKAFHVLLLVSCLAYSLTLCSATTKQMKCVNISCLINMVAWNVLHSLLPSCLCFFWFLLHSKAVSVNLKKLANSDCDGLTGGSKGCNVLTLFILVHFISFIYMSQIQYKVTRHRI